MEEWTDPVIAIGTMAQKLRISVSTLRRYEGKGLIIPYRSEGGHRLFSYEDLTRLRRIRHLIRNVGLNIEGVRRLHALLPCWDIVRCPLPERCLAYHSRSSPCWMRKDQGRAECRKCPVYRYGLFCFLNVKQLWQSGIGEGRSLRVIEEMMKTFSQQFQSEGLLCNSQQP